MTSNDETLSAEHLGQLIEEAAFKSKFTPLKLEKTQVPYDFEFPLERETVMKGFWVSRL